jgi:ABC-2 type transport system permease protein
MSASTMTAYRWELRKLASQKRTYIGLGAAAALPVVFVTVMALQSGGPYDAPLGHNLRRTGLALAPVILNFVSHFGAQLAAALVAGDIVASEHAGKTLKMILTRSLRRDQVLAGKTLASFTYVVATIAVLGVAGLTAGSIAWGFHPLTNLSGVRLSAFHTLWLSAVSLGVFSLPLIAVAAFAIMLSTVTRNSAASIVGTLVYALGQEAVAGLVHQSWAKHYLLSDQFDGWHGVFMTPTDWTPIVRAAWVSAVFAAVPLAIAYVVFKRRDVADD